MRWTSRSALLSPWAAPVSRGRQSQLWATPFLLERAGDRPINRPRLRELIRLYDLDGRLQCYEETKHTRAMRADLEEWNEDLRSRRIETTDPRVRRLDNGRALIPTKDDDGEFVVFLDQVEAYRRFKGDFESMGRFCGPGYQSLTKTVRQTIKIDDEATRSADFGNRHLRMAYAKVGADPGEDDAYLIAGYETRRGTVKVAANIALNCKRGRGQAVDTVAWELAKEDRRLDVGTEEGATIGPYEMRSADRMLTAIETRHKAIEGVFYTGAGLGFMKLEADVIAATARRARRTYNIPVLGIHDEVIVPAGHVETVKGIMAAEWDSAFRCKPL